ncbi:outer membrane lipid asymmetry maintenance protein MlaD [Pacificimonas flava]|uniref:Outer membrane lipid asymmetry maintenance protein MlaD n=2 Tax=Pacificimonas TaxID=1960290 RepID=A0A219B1X5_9SPHN|nr:MULTISPECIES: outer membrane lipid asymmetry maintenance protein MlaD [Pacificimonas]MBZ6378043.1 outer membrane lipid asymmetry maintenance protein MlaD [Pacificimonas aurantium]OWV32315.1 outer membrane lipid asymmetry maintenance protein MlaD [Pacificimonas flava]
MMNQMFRQNLIEAVVGLLVLVVAVFAVLFFYEKTSASTGDSQYVVTALFDNAAGVDEGTDVRVSGVTIGQVTSYTLEEQFPFRAKLELAINDRYELPLDSSAQITSEGILGGTYIALSPGGDTEVLRSGDQIMNTQGSVDMMGLVGQFINQTGSDSGSDSSGSGSGSSLEGGFGNLEEPAPEDEPAL